MFAGALVHHMVNVSVLLVYCWCTAGVLLVYCWCTAGVLLVYCWCTAGVLLFTGIRLVQLFHDAEDSSGLSTEPPLHSKRLMVVPGQLVMGVGGH
jgi:hypothetical protein